VSRQLKVVGHDASLSEPTVQQVAAGVADGDSGAYVPLALAEWRHWRTRNGAVASSEPDPLLLATVTELCGGDWRLVQWFADDPERAVVHRTAEGCRRAKTRTRARLAEREAS